jgi:transposase
VRGSTPSLQARSPTKSKPTRSGATSGRRAGATASCRSHERSIAELCREHEISETLLRRWREQALEAASERLARGRERSQASEQRRRIAELERALGKKTYELEILGNGFRAWE